MKGIEMIHNFDLKEGSEAEEFFIKKIMPECKDQVACQLGELFGREFNRYVMSHEDYMRIKDTNLYSELTGNNKKKSDIVSIGLAILTVISVAGTTYLFKALNDFESGKADLPKWVKSIGSLFKKD